MQWEFTAGNAQHEVYRLVHEDKVLLTLTLNPRSQAARVECNREQRVFLVRKEGFLKNRTVLRNEYGIRIGEIGHTGMKSFIEVNGRRFGFAYKNDPLAELILYGDDEGQPLIRCGLDTRKNRTAVHFDGNHSLPDAPHPSLLMALCWYLFLPVAKENTLEFAAG